MKWLLDRLEEPSTWMGVLAVITTFCGVDMTFDQKEAINNLIIVLLSGGLVATKG